MPASPPRAVPAADADDLSRRLLTALVCAAVEPKLSGVLLFDLPDAHLSTVAEVLEGLLAGPAGPHVAAVPRTTLTAATMDEDLWLRPRMSRGPLGIDFALAPGPLTEPVGPSTVVVPDLARLSVPGKRAAVRCSAPMSPPSNTPGCNAVGGRPPAGWPSAARKTPNGSPHTSWTASRSASLSRACAPGRATPPRPSPGHLGHCTGPGAVHHPAAPPPR